MDRGLYLPIPSHLLLSHPEISHGFDEHELLENTTASCTRTHACNAPSVPLHVHTHTTQAVASGEDDSMEEEPRNPRRPLGNREAVRKYREKKKARTAFLEEEVRKLRAANQMLLRRLRGHAALEAEVMGLTSLLLDVRAKIDAEVGSAICADHTTPCFDTDAEVAAAREHREIDESSLVSGQVVIPEVDAVASFVNSAAA